MKKSLFSIFRWQPLSFPVFFRTPLLLIAFFSVLAGCDCLTEGDGVVIDSSTLLPLDSVVAKSYIKKGKHSTFEMEMTTDSSGYFYGSTGLTGGGFGCPDLVIELSKNGYQTQSVTNPWQDTIRLEK